MEKRDKQLNEEIKRFQKILEYNYYVNEADDEELDLGNSESEDLNLDNPEGEKLNLNNPEGGNSESEDLNLDEPTDETPEDDTTEIDVTDIVQSQEETNEKTEELAMKLDNVTSKLSSLFSKLGELENNATRMQDILSKVDSIAADVKMMQPPTPEETAEALAQDSYPYNVRLSKYGQEGVDETQTDLEKRKSKLSLTDLLNSFNEREVKDSFALKNPLVNQMNKLSTPYK